MKKRIEIMSIKNWPLGSTKPTKGKQRTMKKEKPPMTVECKKCGFENTLRRLCQKCGKELEKVGVTEADKKSTALEVIFDKLKKDSQERHMNLQKRIKCYETISPDSSL